MPRRSATGHEGAGQSPRAGGAQRPLRAHAEGAVGRHRGEHRAAHLRDLPRALQGLVRRQVGVGADRARAGGRRGGRGGRRVRARGADVAAADLRPLRRLRPDRDRAPCARRPAPAGRLPRADVQPGDGAAAARARIARADRRNGNPRRDLAPRAMSDEPRGPHAPPSEPGDRPASPPPGLPRHRRGAAPQGRSRYPAPDVLARAGPGDEVPRKVVLAGVENVPPVRFFDAREEATMRAFCDVVTAQDSEPRVPVLEMVDAKLHAGRLDGFQYADMPDDRDVWRLAAKGLDDIARARGAETFDRASDGLQLEIVAAFHKGELAGGIWDDMPAAKAFSVLMRAVLSAFYSHPWAWNEIGFGGPAYPRGYARLGIGLREAWEGAEDFDVDPVRDVQERGTDR